MKAGATGGSLSAQPASGCNGPAPRASGSTPAHTGIAMSSSASSAPQLRILATASSKAMRNRRVPASSAGDGGLTRAARPGLTCSTKARKAAALAAGSSSASKRP